MNDKKEEVKLDYSEAKKVLKEYLEAWKKKNFKKMLDNSQKTYRQNHSVNHIIEYVGSKKPTSYKIGEPKRVGECMVDFPVEIYYTQQKEKFHKKINVRLIQEISPYTPSINGWWGVNPISTFKEHEIKKGEEK